MLLLPPLRSSRSRPRLSSGVTMSSSSSSLKKTRASRCRDREEWCPRDDCDGEDMDLGMGRAEGRGRKVARRAPRMRPGDESRGTAAGDRLPAPDASCERGTDDENGAINGAIRGFICFSYKERFLAALPPSRRASTDFGRPAFTAAAFYLCSKRHKLKADKLKFLIYVVPPALNLRRFPHQ